MLENFYKQLQRNVREKKVDGWYATDEQEATLCSGLKAALRPKSLFYIGVGVIIGYQISQTYFIFSTLQLFDSFSALCIKFVFLLLGSKLIAILYSK